MFKIILVSCFLVEGVFSYAQGKSLSLQLNSLYQKRFKQSQSQKTPIFPIKTLPGNEETNFNIQTFKDMENITQHFAQQSANGISTKNLYNAMEKYIQNSVLSKNTDAFQGCSMKLYKDEKKTCVSAQELYVIPYSGPENKNLLIQRYMDTYVLAADNSHFFSIDFYEKQLVEKNQCNYVQKQWGEDTYMLPNEQSRIDYIDKNNWTSTTAKMIWLCYNSYSFLDDNKQSCNLLQIKADQMQVNDMPVYFVSSFVAKEQSCKVNLQQKKVVKYSKKQEKIVNANNESSSYSIITAKNQHLLIYTAYAYCSDKPKAKQVYENNFSSMQNYTCIGEDNSSYYSNYRLLGVDPEERSSSSEDLDF
ncbi:MAG: hypothetical protein HAW63_04580 [Bdellovibrionaceae bacterium]|nr:hypothetical protein [Pseudobdellovibrionaceae bacterium]MBE8233701.1 hypothetical protein [Endozoicomonadaceae bacterium]